MAITLRLSNYAQTVTSDLLGGTLYGLMDSWNTVYGDGKVIETLTLTCRGKTDAEIMTAVQVISEMQESVRLFWDNPLNGKSIWWEEKADSETAKRALVYSIELIPIQRSRYTRLLGKQTAFYSLVVEHDEISEDVSETTIIDNRAIVGYGGKYTIAAIKGSAPARISSLEVKSLHTDYNCSRFYAGIRPTGPGIADYRPIIDMSYAIAGTGTTINGSTATISFDSYNELDEFRIRLPFSNLNLTYYSHMVGDYWVLMNGSGSQSSDEFLVRLKSGYYLKKKVHEDILLDGTTAYNVIGMISIPPIGYRSEGLGAGAIYHYELDLCAKRLSGNSDLTISEFILIPAKHFIHIQDAEIEYQDAYVLSKTLEDGNVGAWQLAYGVMNVEEPVITNFCNWEVPIEGGCFTLFVPYCAPAPFEPADPESYSHLHITMKAFLRHRMHREA
jgi:hypothetical protein